MIVGTTQHPLINPEPITLKGIHTYNSRLFRIYTDRTGKEYTFSPTEKKTGGSAIGTIYQKNHQVGSDKKWMGKVGNPKAIPNDPDSTRTRSRRGINVDTIFEKLAYDLFQELGRGYFEVPKTHLADLPLFNEFTSDHALALLYQGEVGMNHSLRIMSSYIKGYQDLKEAQTLDSDKAIGLMDFIKRYRRPPESIFTPEGTLVPLDGMMALLAVGRLLADVDLLGGRGMNAGFKWVYNENGHIVSARVVKIDPGYAFQFIRDPESQDACTNWVINTHHGLGPVRYHLEDLKDLQTSTSNFTTRIEFDKFTSAQKDQFLGALLNTARYLKSDQVLDLLFFRDGRFNYSREADLSQGFAEQTKQEMVDWINWQLEIYQEPLQEFKQRHPEQLLKIRYIDAFGELALSMSDKTYPIRELFSDLALVIPEEKQEHPAMDMGFKVRTRAIKLTELFDGTTRTVLITGEPGTGKSTLCQKIAHDWASGRLFADKFSAVIWIPLRHFNGRDLGHPLHEAIATYLAEVILDAPNLMPCVLATIEQKPVLYVLDGFDEAVDPVRRFFMPLLQDQHVLMTARPETQNLPTTWDRKIENSGFSSAQVKVYIEQFFEGSQTLLRKIQNQPSLQSLAKNPFHLQMLCHLTKENVSVDSLTELYATMIDQILKWEANRLGKAPNPRLLPLLGRALALAKDWGENLSDKHLDQALNEGYTKEQLIETGLIKKSAIDSAYDVVHASVGEYLIANWLSESPQEMQAFFSKDHATEQEQNILRLLCGIEHRKGRAQLFFQNLNVLEEKEENPYSVLRNLYTALACINECKGLHEEIPSIKPLLESNLNEAIEHMARSGWLEALKWINHRNPKIVVYFRSWRKKALHVAAGSGRIEIIQWLCAQDRSLLQKADNIGRTPLHFAASSGQVEAMQWLCDQDPSLLQKADNIGRTPLHYAALFGQVVAMQWLYARDPSLLQKADTDRVTPLHCAAEGGHVDAMQWLCDKDPSLFQKATNHSVIPLHVAALHGQIDSMQWLCDQDPSLLQKAANNGDTPLHFAVFDEGDNGNGAMQWLCDKDSSLLQKADNNGCTPLHIAAKRGDVKKMQWLCDKDPSLLQKADNRGRTPLHYAAEHDDVKAIQWLCEQDPSLLQKADNRGRIPLHYAARRSLGYVGLGNKVGAMEWLCDQDPSLLRKTDNGGQTPLHCAAKNGKVKIMQLLCNQDRSLLQKTANYGRTPLHSAAEKGQVEAMQWLCDQDRSLLQKADNDGYTPLYYAAKNGQVEATQWLRQQGCKEEKQNRCIVS